MEHVCDKPTIMYGVDTLYKHTVELLYRTSLIPCYFTYSSICAFTGLINEFLSWRGFVPFSRMTYCAYLVQLPTIFMLSGGARSGIVFTYPKLVWHQKLRPRSGAFLFILSNLYFDYENSPKCIIYSSKG